MPNVYIRGVGYGATITGLGNTLFQIATAIYYAEKYNMKIIIERNHLTLFGTSNWFDRDKVMYDEYGNRRGYDYTIFRNFTFTDNLDLSNTISLDNHFDDIKIVPSEDKNINIEGFNQNIGLFKEFLHKIPDYLYLKDQSIIDYIHHKYGDISNTNSMCIGIRIGKDFENVTLPNVESYKKALDCCKEKNINIDKIYVISDVPNILENNFNLKQHCDYVEVVENDIVQIYFGLMCKNFILSQSTYHLWIAYLATIMDNSKKVICFNNSTIERLYLDDWIRIDF